MDPQLVQHDTLKELIDQLPVIVFEYTFYPDGRHAFTYISPRCAELLQVEPSEVMSGSLHMKDFIHPDDLTDYEKLVSETFHARAPFFWEGRCKIGSVVKYLEARGLPQSLDDGRILYKGIITDVTDKKLLELRRHQVEARYRDLVETIPIGIVVTQGGILRFVNSAACRLMKATSPEQLVGKNSLDFVHPDYHELVKSRVAMLSQGMQVPPVHQKFLCLDGSVLEVESIGHAYDYEGSPAIQVIFSDVTELKRAEDSFRKSEALFFQLFQNTPLAIVLLSQNGKVQQINHGFEELFGFTGSELRGNSLNRFIVPDELQEEGNDINKAIAENRVVYIETKRRKKNGELASVIIYGVPVIQANQKIGIFGMYVDITGRQQMEEELKTRNAELDNFVYKVSHDLRAPLSSVLGLVHLASLPGNTDNLNEYLRLVGQKANQLDHFISDVLSHSKNLKMDVRLESIRFKELIQKAFADLSYLKGHDQVDLELVTPDGSYVSDPWRMGEIFRNLVSNAIKYRSLDKQRVSIRIAIELREEGCFIEFTDNGIGIGEEHLARIFEMFFRASVQAEGSGLGLYIVRNAVEKLGGRIYAESEIGKGTTFKIVLPRHPVTK